MKSPIIYIAPVKATWGGTIIFTTSTFLTYILIRVLISAENIETGDCCFIELEVLEDVGTLSARLHHAGVGLHASAVLRSGGLVVRTGLSLGLVIPLVAGVVCGDAAGNVTSRRDSMHLLIHSLRSWDNSRETKKINTRSLTLSYEKTMTLMTDLNLSGARPVKEYINTWIPPAAAGNQRRKQTNFCHSPNSPITSTKSS